jgi:hypothetical protein
MNVPARVLVGEMPFVRMEAHQESSMPNPSSNKLQIQTQRVAA